MFDISDRRLSQICLIVFSLLGVAFLGWIVWNALLAIPAVDDFCYGAGAHERGVIQNVVIEYFTWGGRYTAAFLISAFAGADTLLFHYYYLVPLTILVLNFFAVRHFLSSVDLKTKAMLLLFFVILMTTFRMRESLFWLSGGATYGVSCALFLVLIAEEWRIFTGAVQLRWQRTLVLSLASILLASFNETVMLAHVTLLFPLLVVSLATKNNRAVAWIMAAAIVGALISGLAPGNFLRAGLTPHNTNVLIAAWVSFTLLVTKYALPILVSVLMFRCLLWFCRVRRDFSFTRNQAFAFCLFLLLALWASIFARAYALNELGPERARTIDFLLVNLIGFFVATQLYQRSRARSEGQPRPLLAGLIACALIATIVSSVFAPHLTWKPLLDGMQESVRLRDLITARLNLVSSAKGQTLVVEAYTQDQKPITFFNDIKEDPKQWENGCFAKYFGLKEIRTRN
ncbi:DUF6056 family protein [Herbaspirillum rhizosphaerae]|uniref:DUF6056 family protein n=1 Tax=Herbaspirillum rhizosphaerae TaxID=346179 RepID=UPI00067E3844|nr:DUF6056 family protein [Herbaspirillum rhizosphaerae]